MKNPIQERRFSETKFRGLADLIADAIMEATRAGVQATEVWLGPKQARVMQVELGWQEYEGRLVHANANESAMIRGDMEGAEVMGLRVRLAAKDGVRVGVSYPSELHGPLTGQENI